MVVLPQPVAVARPEVLIVATLAALEDQVAFDVRFSGGTLVSVVVPIAVNCIV